METHYSYEIHKSQFLLIYDACNSKKRFQLHAINERKDRGMSGWGLGD